MFLENSQKKMLKHFGGINVCISNDKVTLQTKPAAEPLQTKQVAEPSTSPKMTLPLLPDVKNLKLKAPQSPIVPTLSESSGESDSPAASDDDNDDVEHQLEHLKRKLLKTQEKLNYPSLPSPTISLYLEQFTRADTISYVVV